MGDLLCKLCGNAVPRLSRMPSTAPSNTAAASGLSVSRKTQPGTDAQFSRDNLFIAPFPAVSQAGHAEARASSHFRASAASCEINAERRIVFGLLNKLVRDLQSFLVPWPVREFRTVWKREIV